MARNNRTEVYYQPAFNDRGLRRGQRYRLLYQDEQGHWVASFNWYSDFSDISYTDDVGCFSSCKRFKTKAKLIKAMRKYDKKQRFPKAVKLGDFL